MRSSIPACFISLVALYAAARPAAAQTSWSVSNAADLTAALAGAFNNNVTNPGLLNTITLAGNISGSSQWIVNANVNIVGNSYTIDMNNADRAFFIAGGTVGMSNLSITNGNAAGGSGGGGGAGLGGAIFVGSGSYYGGVNPVSGSATIAAQGLSAPVVSLSSVTFSGNQAVGGAGSAGSGGGMGGNGSQSGGDNTGQGGGGFGAGANGGAGGLSGNNGSPGSAGAFVNVGAVGGASLSGGAGGNGSSTNGGPGGANGGGGGGGGLASFGYPGTGGGGGVAAGRGYFGNSDSPNNGGNGGFGGGGGSNWGSYGSGGNGGFGGGGGSGSLDGGTGGFGGGGGGAGPSYALGQGGFGAANAQSDGDAGNGIGGGGLGAGGALFVMPGATVTVQNGTFSGNSVAGGTTISSNQGSAYGTDVFLGANVTFDVATTLSVSSLGGAGNLADPNVVNNANDPNAQGGIIKTGNGTLTLTGTSYYSGITTVNSGTLALAPSATEQGTTVVTVGQNAGDVATLGLGSSSTLTLGGFNGASGTDAPVVIAQAAGSTGTVVIGNGAGSNGSFVGARVFTGGAGHATVQFTQQYAAEPGTIPVYPFYTSLTGSLGIVQAGAGTTLLQPLYGANTFSGPVTVNVGTLETTGTAAALAGATSITVNAEGALLLGQTNGVNDSAAVTLAGGELFTGTSLSETFGALNVSVGGWSIINFMGNSSTLNFSSLSLDGSLASLAILNYDGANDFLNIASGTATGSLSRIAFYSDSGSTLLGYGGFEGTRLVPVAVPEPSTLAISLTAIACTGWSAARHRRRQFGGPGCVVAALAGLACLAGTGVAHAQQPVVIPLTQTSQRFEIYVGVNGGPAFPYMFDTGSQIFEASQTVLASTTVSGTLATGVVEQYVDNGFVYDVVTVNSIQFYASGSATAPVVSLDAGGGGFRMGSVTGTFSGTNSATPTPVNTPAFMAPYCGIFGAGSFTSLVSGSVAIGSILGQATTTGWVVAGNGPSSATPAVVLGLDATLRSGFTSGTNAAVYNWISGTAPFPLSNAASSAKNAVVMNLAVQSGTAAVAWSTPALFDTGTPTNNLRPDPATLEALQTVNAISTGIMNGSLTDYLSVGATLAVTGTAGGFSYAPPLESFDTVTSYGYPPWVFPVHSSGTDAPTTTLGLGFFLTNSVMYDLENGQIGVTTAYVVPEPPGCWMASAGLACGGVVMWRRRRRVGDQGSSLVSIRRCMR